ncbi:MAG TPA: GNAT family N-acetyltransferase [Solirubrobacteraceae bacterium]|nr:GNAT family N-acetyltransferase [Solirubrobacteraceae bacterium]
MWDLKPRLEGRIVTLEPLRIEHREALLEAARPTEAWDWWSVDMSTPAAVEAWLQSSLEAAERGERAPFATLDSTSGRAIGSTSFMTLHPEHATLEIGWTWLSPSAWNGGANIEAKLLMLRHAFAVLGCQRVEFVTHERNERSRRCRRSLRGSSASTASSGTARAARARSSRSSTASGRRSRSISRPA